MSSDWCYPLCALVTLVLRLVGFDNPCRLGTEMVSLVGVIRLVHILLPVPYTHRVARVRYFHALRRFTTIVDSGLAWVRAVVAGSWLHRPALVTFGLRTCVSVDWYLSSWGCLGSEPSACCLGLPHSGSVHCLCCLCDVRDTGQFSSSLDECRSDMGPGLLILH